MAKISGIYVEIRGDSTQLRKDLATARQHVTEQATGMSNALNNALSPAQLKNNINGIVRNLNTLSQASKLTGKEFGAIGADLKDLQRLTGISEKAFRDLQSRMLQTSAAKAQEKALQSIARAAGLSAKEVSQLGKQMGVSASSIAAVNGAAKSSASAMTMLGSAARAALAYFSVQTVVEFGRAIMDAGIAMDSLQRSFVAVTGSQAGAAETLSFLRKESDRLGQNFYALAPEFKNVMAAARGTAMEGENVRKMFSAIAGASTALGLSADDTHGTLRALQQMMSKGTIQAEELKGQLGERLPGALDLMAKAMGVSTAELNKMMEDGKLLADEALPKLTKEIERVYGAAAETAAFESARSAVNKLSEAWTDFKVNLFDNEEAVAGINAITSALKTLTEYAGLRSVSNTFAQGAGLAAKGLIDFDVFKAAGYLERQRMVDEFIDSQKVAAKNFTATWAAAEQQNLESFERYNERRQELEAAATKKREDAAKKANEELRKLTQTDMEKLAERRDKLIADGADRVATEKWYAGEVAKLNEKSTKKFLDEQKKQLEAHKKAREEMLNGGKAAEQAIEDWQEKYDKRRVDAIAESTAKTVKLREDEAKAAADAARKIAEEQEAAAQKVMDRIQEGTADVFYDMFQDIGKGWETLWDSMKSWALRTLAELAARAATVNIVVPIMTQMTGTSTATEAVNALSGGQGGFGNLPFGSLMGGDGGMFSGLTSSINAWGASTFPNTFTGGVALAGPTQSGAPLVSTGPSLMGTMGSVAGIAGGVYQMSQGGTGNTVAGAGTAIGSGLMMVPGWGTVAGAIVVAASQILGSLIGNEEQSPSVIYQAQQMGWGSVDPTTYQFHTKDGAKSKTGNEISAALAAVAGGAFQQVEATVAALGEQYVDILKESTVEWGRKAGGTWKEWDFGADMDMDELFAKASADLTRQIYKASATAFEAAGKDILASESTATALSMLSEKAAGSFQALQDAIAAGVQDGNVEAFVAQIQQFQTAMQTVNAVWDSVSQASAELVTPLTQYEQAQRAINQQYDGWIAQLNALGFASEKIRQIEADRGILLDRLAAEQAASIAGLVQQAQLLATPMTSAQAAIQRVNDQFDDLVDQLKASGAAASDLAAVEASRQLALTNAARQNAAEINAILDSGESIANPLSPEESAKKQIQDQFDSMWASLVDRGADREDLDLLTSQRDKALEKLDAKLADEINDILDNAESIANPLSAEEAAKKQIQDQFDSMWASLVDHGADREDLDRLTSLRDTALENLAAKQAEPAEPAEPAANLASAWADVSRQAQDAANPLTGYALAVHELSEDFDDWKASLVALGIDAAKVAKLDEWRAQALERLAAENEANIAQMIADASAIASPMTAVAVALRDTGAQFDDLAAQMRDAGATAAQLEQVEESRAVAMERVRTEYAKQIDDAMGQAANLAFPLTELESAIASANSQFDALAQQLVQAGASADQLAMAEQYRAQALERLAAENEANIAQMIADASAIASPMTAVAVALRDTGAQFDALAAQMRDAGATAAQLEQVEESRAVAMERVRAEYAKQIDDAMGQAANLAFPLTELESAIASVNSQFDALAQQLVQAGASADQLAMAEQYRAQALANVNINSAVQAVDAARAQLRESYQAEAAQLEENVRKWDSIADSLREWRRGILLSDLSPIRQGEQARAAFPDILARAKLGDEEAIGQLQSVAEKQLSADKDAASTAEDYARSAWKTLAEVEAVESVASRHASISQQQLDEMTRQVSELITINESVLSVRDAIAQLVAAQQTAASLQPYNLADTPSERSAKVEAQTGVKVSAGDAAMVAAAKVLYQSIHGGASTAEYNRAAAAVGGDIAKALGWDGSREGADELRKIYGFAAGGMHSGGLRLVGENGPELEVTGPARIWNAEDTKALLSGRGDGTASEIRALRDDLRAIGRALAKNTADTAKLMQRWDGDGMPEVRVA